MGNVVGNLVKLGTRKARRFNVESRTERFLDKNVKVAPPKLHSTEVEIERINQELPHSFDEIHKRNPELLDRLKDVYVSSSDKPPKYVPRNANPERPLPVERKSAPEEFGYVEPINVTPGRLTLRQALQLLSKYQTDKVVYNTEKLAEEYNLSVKDVGNIVNNFKLFTLVDLGKKEDKEGKPSLIDKDSVNIMTMPEVIKNMQEFSNKSKKGKSDEKPEVPKEKENK